MNFLLVLAFLGLINTAHAQEIVYTPETAREIIYAFAVRYAVNGDELYATLKCESNLNPAAIGDDGTSVGVAQIHLPAHLDITKQEALSPIFSINFAAQQFAAGHQHLWSCYKGSASG